MKPAVFIQTNNKQLLGAKVAAHALKRNSKRPEAFDVRFLRVEDFPRLYSRAGQEYLREGARVSWKNDDLQSFTPTRFLPPQLMGYQGLAVVIDPDVFALADVMDLIERDMEGKAIFCRRILPKDGRKPYWATSVMLLDCSKLAHWRWDEAIDELFAFKRDYRDWMSLWLEDQSTIGLLDDSWNHYDLLTNETRMLHNTGRLTQPWKTGLPIDFTPQAHKDRSLKERVLIAARGARDRLRGTQQGVYLAHPDKRQEKLFFSLLKECVSNGSVSMDELRIEMSRQHLRRDALQILTQA